MSFRFLIKSPLHPHALDSHHLEVKPHILGWHECCIGDGQWMVDKLFLKFMKYKDVGQSYQA